MDRRDILCGGFELRHGSERAHVGGSGKKYRYPTYYENHTNPQQFGWGFMPSRQAILAAALVSSTAFGFVSSEPVRRNAPLVNPCRIGGEGVDTLAFEHLGRVLTDTGAGASSFAWLRDTLGIAGVNISSVAVVQDTISCRRALNAWKAFYTALGAEQASEAGYVKGGLLLRLTPNRFALAVAVFHPWTGATFFVLDSNFVMVRNGLM